MSLYKSMLHVLDVFNFSHCSSLKAHWLSVLGDSGSNPGGGEKISSFVFELPFLDACLPLN